MNKKIVLGIVICAVLFGLCGCSWTKSISEDDEREIATYSAKIVAKYNTKQKDGIVHIDQSDEDKIAGEKLEELVKQQQANSTTNSTASNNSTANNSTQPKNPVPLSNALGLTGVDFAYLGQEVRGEYTTSIYSMAPNSGNSFLVMKFRMTNTSGTAQDVNILSLNPKFKATINGGVSANNEMSLMPEDLATFTGSLAPGESRELIIIFQFKSGDLANISSVSLQCTVKGNTNDIIL